MTRRIRDALWRMRVVEERGNPGLHLPDCHELDDLIEAGLIRTIGEDWRLTEAGWAALRADAERLRAACRRAA